jgi:hypothetical protein
VYSERDVLAHSQRAISRGGSGQWGSLELKWVGLGKHPMQDFRESLGFIW